MAHVDLVVKILLSLAIITVAAKIGGLLATRFGQSPVLGELMAGMLLGNLTLIHVSTFEYLKRDPVIDGLAQLGVILLLFQVGLESTVAQMLKVGVSSLLVATLGVVGPFLLGWAVGVWLIPTGSSYEHIFLGATLTATSIGVTARVLKDLGRSNTSEARIVLGAAVIDDVQGLVILAVLTGLVTAANEGAALSYAAIALMMLKAVMFLAAALAGGMFLSPRLLSLAATVGADAGRFVVGLAFCFVVAWGAAAVGLAPIVGAFAAGLVLDESHDRDVINRGSQSLHHLIAPVAAFLTPVFFVLMGMRTELRVFAEPSVVALATALTIAAILGKQFSAFGAVEAGLDRLSIGVGMIPRGEVGLIFANVGLGLVLGGQPLLNQSLFSAIVAMVIATTIITPPALKWSFARFDKRNAALQPAGRH